MSPKKIELAFSVAVLLFLAWALWEARGWPVHSKLFPWSLGLAVSALALIQVAVALRSAWKEGRGGVVVDDVIRWRVITICGWVLAFFLGIWLLGFKIGSLVLTVAFLKLAANENWRVSSGLGISTYLFFLLVFDFALRVPLGGGAVGDSLGIDSLDTYLLRPVFGLFTDH